MNRSLRFSLVLFSFIIIPALHAQQNVELVNSGEILLTADLYNSLGHYSKAEAALLKVGRNDTNYAEVLRDLAYTYNNDNEDSLCLATARKGKELDSEFKADFYDYMGISLKQLEKYDTALKTFDEGIRLYPYKYILYYQKGMTYFKMKKYPEAEECFKKAIELNPYHANSHFQLGKCCAEQGRVVPAVLSWQYFLMLENNTERSQKVVSYLEDLYNGESQADPDFQLTAHEAGDDCFSDLQQVIDSKAAFDPSYKNKTGIELKMVKMFQSMLEKMHYDANTGNFWMENYVPFFLELQKKNYLAPYEGYALFAVSDNPSVKKSEKKNKKKITEFRIWAAKYIDTHTRHPAKADFPDGTELEVTFYTNNMINGIGATNAAGLEDGTWEYFYGRTGKLLSKGTYTNGLRTGEWIWYYENGTVKERSKFRNGLREGESEQFFSNGLTSFKATYEKGLVEGEYTAYDISGYKTQQASMFHNQLNGLATAYYENGAKKAELNYLNGKLNGEFTVYTLDGKVSKKINYVNDLRQGNAKEYFEGKLQSEGDYKADERFGHWKTYFEDGTLYEEGDYKDKGLKNGQWDKYFRNGKLASKYFYTAGKLNGVCTSYDTDGKIYCEYKYAAGKLKTEKFYNKDGSVLAENTITDDYEVTEYYPSGLRMAKGRYYMGERTGDWKIYNENGGWLSAKEHYNNGYLSGTRTEYFENGEEASELDYHSGDRDGYLKSYFANGTLRSEGWYVSGNKQGDWYEYNQRGVVQSHRYFINGELHGIQEYFDERGRKDEETFFKDLNVWTRTRFDSTGNVIYKYESDNGNGIYEFKYPGGQPLVHQEYKGGILNGKTERYTMDGTKTVETTFINGDQHGERKEFYENGKISLDATYAYNARHGKATNYWENGAVRSEEIYFNGELDGPQKYYYENGTLMKEGTWVMGNLEGELKLYSDDGALEFIRYYNNGNILGYSYLDKDGKPVPMIPLENASGKFTAYYQNGNKSIEGEYLNGRFNGNVVEYFSNGKVAEDENYKIGDYEGVQKYYYHNDSLKRVQNYYGDELDGWATYYYDNGKVEHKEYHVLGDNFGSWTYYNKDGVELKQVQYYDDRQLNVILSTPAPANNPKSKPAPKPKPAGK
jgi:antitoxin component YwqK of YwqJK toxin-antitoxin module/Tfp pilus assembly protein PilF